MTINESLEALADLFSRWEEEQETISQEAAVAYKHCAAELRALARDEARELIDERTELECMRLGYVTERDFGFKAVNACPFGPAISPVFYPRAEAWYRGYWFHAYVMRPWKEACRS